MSIELIQLVEKMNSKDIETQIALQCAPLISGIKISNILITNKHNAEKVEEIFKDAPFSYRMIYQNNQRITYVVYQKEQLETYISGMKESTLLYALGYENIELTVLLQRFATRFTEYMHEKGKSNDKVEFPHEMGLLLGYPVDDVIGFIVNRGHNAIYTGYWKVYSNLQQAKAIFDSFTKAKVAIVQMVAYGESIENIIRMNWERNITIGSREIWARDHKKS